MIELGFQISVCIYLHDAFPIPLISHQNARLCNFSFQLDHVVGQHDEKPISSLHRLRLACLATR